MAFPEHPRFPFPNYADASVSIGLSTPRFFLLPYLRPFDKEGKKNPGKGAEGKRQRKTYSKVAPFHVFQRPCVRLDPPLGPERAGVFAKHGRQMVQRGGAHADVCTLWQESVAEDDTAGRRESFKRDAEAWAEAHRFFYDGLAGRREVR